MSSTLLKAFESLFGESLFGRRIALCVHNGVNHGDCVGF